MNIRDRLLRKVCKDTNSGCWLWTGSKNDDGYGRILISGRIQMAHRASYLLHKGAIENGKHVCHSCDQPSCLNPDHLFIGDAAINMADKVAKGRQAIGSRNGQAKLTEATVLEIRSQPGVSRRRLAAKYGISKTQVQRILTRETWMHL